MDQILQWFEANAGKIIFLLVAIVAALLITKGLARAVLHSDNFIAVIQRLVDIRRSQDLLMR